MFDLAILSSNELSYATSYSVAISHIKKAEALNKMQTRGELAPTLKEHKSASKNIGFSDSVHNFFTSLYTRFSNPARVL